MELQYKSGLYSGEAAEGLPHGKGTLYSDKGFRRGLWHKGLLTEGCEYLGDRLYVGGFDSLERYHGKGFYEKEGVITLRGSWDHGEFSSFDSGQPLPNCVLLRLWRSGMPYGGIEPAYLAPSHFPQRGGIGRRGYQDRVAADHYELPELSKAFGLPLVYAVEAPDNCYDFSRRLNTAASFFLQEDKPLYTEAWLCSWNNGDYAPLPPGLAFKLNEHLHAVLSEEGMEEICQSTRTFSSWKYALTGEGICRYTKGEAGQQLRLVYGWGDPQGRAFYEGEGEKRLPHGKGKLHFFPDCEDLCYEGHLEQGLFHGEGVLYKRNGEQWSGLWKQGRFEGEENAVFIGGAAIRGFKGSFTEGKLIRGRYFDRRDPSHPYEYEGEFLDFLPHGFGTETEGGKKKTGYFHKGKLLIGSGEEAANALELLDPYTLRPLEIREFSSRAYALQLGSEMICHTEGEALQTLSRKAGAELLLVYSQKEDAPENRFLQERFGIRARGSALLCRKGEATGEALSPEALSCLQKELEAQIISLQKAAAYDRFSAEVISLRREYEETVTKETHDDYPLAGEEIEREEVLYRIRIGGECYCGRYQEIRSTPWDAYHDSIDALEASARLCLHKLPEGLWELAELKEDPAPLLSWCEKENKWSETLFAEPFSGTKREFSEFNKAKGFLALLMSRFFGKELKQE